MHKILLVEDDLMLASVLKDYFEEEMGQLSVLHVLCGEDAIAVHEKVHSNLILLDIVLPGMNGYEVIAEIRKKDHHVPIILMTGSEMEYQSEIKGYNAGAVNFLKKPVRPEFVLAVVKSLLHIAAGTINYTLGGYHIAIQKQLVKIGNVPLKLRVKDVQVLSLLLRNQEELVNRQYLLQRVWGDDEFNMNNTLDSSISRIRKAFKPYPGIMIEPIYAEGYILRSVPEKEGLIVN